MDTQRRALHLLLCVGLAGAVICVEEIVNAQAKADTTGVRVTVIGCVQRSKPPLPETIGPTLIPAGETKYVLANITLVPDDDRTGTAGDTSRGNLLAQTVKMYRLDDSADSLVAPRVGDRVRVSGTVVGTPRGTGTTGRTESATIAGTQTPTLRVDSLQKISSDSSTCSQ